MARTMVIPATTVHDSKKRANTREPLDRRTNQTAPAIKVRPAQIGPTQKKIRSTPYQNGLRFSIISPAHDMIPAPTPALASGDDRGGWRPRHRSWGEVANHAH